MATIRILVTDDHPIVRDGLIAVLSTQPDFEIVAEAGNGTEAIAQYNAHRPDVVLLDLEMPEMDGVETLKKLHAQSAEATAQEPRVIVFTAFDTDERILSAVEAGAQGYLLKGAPREELFNAIRIVHAGGSLLQPVVASRLLRQMNQPDENDALVEPLTPREMEVLRLLAQGQQNKEIARTLSITERTAKFHVSAIMGKVGAGNRTEAVAMAAQLGLIDLSA